MESLAFTLLPIFRRCCSRAIVFGVFDDGLLFLVFGGEIVLFILPGEGTGEAWVFLVTAPLLLMLFLDVDVIGDFGSELLFSLASLVVLVVVIVAGLEFDQVFIHFNIYKLGTCFCENKNDHDNDIFLKRIFK